MRDPYSLADLGQEVQFYGKSSGTPVDRTCAKVPETLQSCKTRDAVTIKEQVVQKV